MNISEQNIQISENIQKYGWHCLHILPTQESIKHEKFSYTIGFTETFGAPEVLVFGLSSEKGHALLNECAQLLRSGHILRSDFPDDSVLAGGYKVMFKTVQSKYFDEYLGSAVRYYASKPFQAMVMFLPDKNNVLPGEGSYVGASADEPLSIV